MMQRMMTLRKRKKTLTTVECGINNERCNIYFNEDLPKPTRDLFKKAMELKQKNILICLVYLMSNICKEGGK